jgi:hypothetical protein
MSKYSTLSSAYSGFHADPQDLAHTPTFYQTEPLCTDAVKADGMSLKHVLKKFKTVDICKLAVSQNGMALNYVPAEHHSDDIYMCAVSNDGMAIKLVPKRLQSKQMILAATNQNSKAIEFCDQYQEICDEVVAKDSHCITLIEEKFISEEMCMSVKLFEGIGKYIPAYLRTSQKISDRLDKFYAERGYTTFGPVKIFMSTCLLTNPCKHHIILKDGSARIWLSSHIKTLLAQHGLNDPHFDTKLNL